MKKKYAVPFGTTILEACKENQIHVPTLCHHPDLCIAGTCRVCVVEVEGYENLANSLFIPNYSSYKNKNIKHYGS